MMAPLPLLQRALRVAVDAEDYGSAAQLKGHPWLQLHAAQVGTPTLRHRMLLV